MFSLYNYRTSGYLFYILLCFSICFSQQAIGKKRKTVFIIVDGVPADVIERLNAPAIDEIADRGGYTRAYMGGEVGGLTETPTVSAVCYNSLLTSTWANKHNVWGNGIEDPNYNYWSIFRIANHQKTKPTTAIYSAWEDNRTKLVGEGKEQTGKLKVTYHLDGLENDTVNYPAEENSLHIFKIDEKVSEEAAKCIREKGPDLTWVYLWYMDAAGHEFGDSPHFDQYTLLADKQVQRVWDAVKSREENHNEEWMIVVTTDHGRSASDGKGHGGQSERERTTWISTNIQPNDYFSNHQPGIVDIATSISRFMNFSVPENLQYEQEGVPFIGKISVSDVKATKKEKDIVLVWKRWDFSKVDIYLSKTDNFRKGEKDEWVKVGTVKDGSQFVYKTDEDVSMYKFSIRGKYNSLPVIFK